MGVIEKVIFKPQSTLSYRKARKAKIIKFNTLRSLGIFLVDFAVYGFDLS
jgi:hypothetical protein